MYTVTNKVIDNLTKVESFPFFEKYLSTDFESVVSMIYQEKFKDKDIKEVMRTLKKDYINKTKHRWAKKAIKDYQMGTNKKRKKELAGEWESLVSYIDKNGLQLFQKQFDCQSLEELMQQKINTLLAWSSNENLFLADYLYFHQKTKNQIEKALLLDLTKVLGIVLEQELLNDEYEVIVESPYSTIENPFFGNTRGKMKLTDDILNKEGKNYISHTYHSGDGVDYEFLVDKEYGEKHKYKVPDIDWFDGQIFLEVMSKRDELFATQKTINVTIGDLVRALYNSDGEKNYKAIEERLHKLKYFSLTKVIGNKSVSYGIFDYIEIDTAPNGTRVAEIHVNESIYRDYIDRQTVRMYKNRLADLKLEASNHLIFLMQKERIMCYKAQSDYTINRDYWHFSKRIRFKKRNKQANLLEIEEALEELIKEKLVVQSYKRIGQVLQITFIPMDEKEVLDLLEGDYEYVPLSQYQKKKIPNPLQ